MTASVSDGSRAQRRQLIRELQQRQHGVRDDVRRRLVPREDERHGGGHELSSFSGASPSAPRIRMPIMSSRWATRASAIELAEIGAELAQGLLGGERAIDVGLATPEEGDDVVRPAREVRLVRSGTPGGPR